MAPLKAWTDFLEVLDRKVELREHVPQKANEPEFAHVFLEKPSSS